MTLLIQLYGGFGRLARPALRRMLRQRLGRAKEWPDRLQERFGIATLPRPAGRLIWIHAASVGETMSVLPVIEALPGQEVLLTTGTVTSAALAAARLPAHARHQFVPLDISNWVENFLNHWQPNAAVFVESELWPVTLSKLDEHGIPRLLINARMSNRSAARWRKLPTLARPLLGGFRYIHAQSARDADNLARLGMSDLLLWGNLKFAAPLLPFDEAHLAALRAQIPGPVWLAASTHPGEEEIILQAHHILLETFPALVTIIAPRHPERGAAIATLTNAPRRGLGEAPAAGKIYLADTLGELGLFYRLVPFAFIGGSLVPHGGQNVIEPARLELPVMTGPHTENFAAAAAMLKSAGALLEVHNENELAKAVSAWLMMPEAPKNAGALAKNVFDADEALPARLAALILQVAL